MPVSLLRRASTSQRHDVPSGAGFAVTRSALKLTGRVPGIDRAEFERLAGEAKAGCPISKLLNCEITLETVLAEVMPA